MDTYERQLHWKNVNQKKLDMAAKTWNESDVSECTFTPQIIRDYEPKNAHVVKDGSKNAIDEHLDRQSRARQRNEYARRKGTIKGNKRYDAVTVPVPFHLSTNSKSRYRNVADNNHIVPKTHKKAEKAMETPVVESNNAVDIQNWQSERKTLISIIQAQREELDQRDQAQAEASKVAKRFATAILAFEERLETVENASNAQLQQVNVQLKQQQTTSEKILAILSKTVE